MPASAAADSRQVGSTAALLDFASTDDAREYIVVTESGILFEMRRKCPDKVFLAAPADDAGMPVQRMRLYENEYS